MGGCPAPPAIRHEIGARLRAFRTARHLSQAQLGKMVGLDGATVCQYERGNVGFGVVRLVQLAHALAIPLSQFFADP